MWTSGLRPHNSFCSGIGSLQCVIIKINLKMCMWILAIPGCSTKCQLSPGPCIYKCSCPTSLTLGSSSDMRISIVWSGSSEGRLFIWLKQNIIFGLLSEQFPVHVDLQFNPCKISKTICVCRVTDPAQQDSNKICTVIREIKMATFRQPQ